GSLAVTITRPDASTAQSVQFTTSPYVALAVSDYSAVNTTVSFAVGETSKTVSVGIVGDTAVEGNEPFNLILTSPTNGGVLGAARRASVMILDDDDAGVVEFSATEYDVGEGGGTVTVTATRTGGSHSAIDATFLTKDM